MTAKTAKTAKTEKHPTDADEAPQDVHEEPTAPLVHPDAPLDGEGNPAAPEEIASDEFGRLMDGSVPR